MDPRGAITLDSGVGKAAPPATELAIIQSGMSGLPFNPGRPIGPFNGYSTTPRSHDFQTGYNISARPRLNERVSFDTLRGVVESYDFAQICIWHKIDSLRSLDWSLVAAPGVNTDVSEQITYATRILRRPDGKTRLKTILAKFLYDVFAYDAGCLARVRNRAGQVIGFKHVDGTTIAPLIDDWGDRPTAPAPAYVQYIQGVPYNWLTEQDLIYEPFRPATTSPYGRAPIESVLLNANTDLRFQMYFLQRFTDGNVPEAFASSPEGWTTNQIKEFQTAWDALLYGEQSQKHQIKWVPHGTTFAWSNEKDFQDTFSLFMARKTMAAYHIVPSDLGLTEDVNRATADTQVDVQYRIGDLPGVDFIQATIDSFLQDDLGLQIAFQMDTGQEKEDRYVVAQAHQLYVNMGAESVDEVRDKELGLPIDNDRPTPRFVMTSRSGPVPLNALLAVAGAVDPETASPTADAALPVLQFRDIPGVVTSPPLPEPSLAADEFGPAAVPPPPPADLMPQMPAPIGKADTVGLTSATGAYGSPLLTDPDDEDDEQPSVVKAELASFTRFVKARRKAGKWRDFTFTAIPETRARQLNADARAEVRKDAGQLIAAGLCVRAADTGRVLMLQRGFTPDDPARGLWEFPGGHIEDGEEPLDAAWREWQEETGCLIPADATVGHTWSASNGIYSGWIASIPQEADLNILARGQVINPDDPDGDVTEAIAWWDPALLAGNPAIRPELAADLELVLTALTPPTAEAAPTGGPSGAVEVGKAKWRDHPADTPAADYDLRITDHYTPIITEALIALWTTQQLRSAVEQMAAEQTVAKSVNAPLPDPQLDKMRRAITQLLLDAYLAGDHVGGVQLGAGALAQISDINWDVWTPGDAKAAAYAANGALQALLDSAGQRISGITDTTLRLIGDRIADGLAAGDSIDTVAQSLTRLLGDTTRAVKIAHTETARAMTASTLDTYQINGIGQYNLVTSGGACAICLAAEAANPHALSDQASAAPLHPLCRCAVSPVTPRS